MKRTLMLLALVTLLAAASAALAQDAQPKGPEMHMYQLVLVRPGPNWQSMHTQEGQDFRMQVINNIKKAAKRGAVVSAGVVNDDSDVEFIFVLDIEDKYAAEALLNNAELVKNGVYKPEIYSWFATKIDPIAGK
ncbi:MAG TPA: hypothetical protein PLQ13_14715 [Candidatus Krumholzibacteria bacterium]|nr:hypothetical protein [Candidatus Krumholzibacteria bacterium]